MSKWTFFLREQLKLKPSETGGEHSYYESHPKWVRVDRKVSLLRFPHLWFLEGGEAEHKCDRQTLAFDVCPPSLPHPRALREDGAWCGFLTPSGTDGLRLSLTRLPHLKPGINCLLSSKMNQESQASPNLSHVSVLPERKASVPGW